MAVVVAIVIADIDNEQASQPFNIRAENGLIYSASGLAK